MNAILAQVGVPTLTGPQIMLFLAIAGGVVFLVRVGILIGAAAKTIKEMPEMFKELSAKVERLAQAVEHIDTRLSRLEAAHG